MKIITKQICPACHKTNHLLGGECRCPSDAVDKALAVGSAFDWIGPTSELTGISPGCILLLCALIMAVLALMLGQN